MNVTEGDFKDAEDYIQELPLFDQGEHAYWNDESFDVLQPDEWQDGWLYAMREDKEQFDEICRKENEEDE